jgi:hypothetical protein
MGMTQPVSSAAGSLASALAGMQAADRSMDADAASIAANGPSVDAIVDLGSQPIAYSANVAVLKAALDLERSTFDVLA